MPKRGENIYKRKDGRWEGRYIKCRVAGKVRYGYIYGYTYTEVKDRLFEAKSQVKNSVDEVVYSETSVADIANVWLENIKISRKPSTYVKYYNILNSYIIPVMGNMNICNIGYTELDSFCGGLLKHGRCDNTGLSCKTVSDILSVVKSVLRYAARKRIPVDVSAYEVTVNIPRNNIRVLTRQEEYKLIEYLEQNISPKNLGILLCLFTGMRIGELCALQYKNILVSDKRIHVSKTMQRIQTLGGEKRTKVVIAEPKSRCSVRDIPLPEMIARYFPMDHADEAYILSGNNTYVEPRIMQTYFKKVLKDCNIANANFHSLRHTFATRCVEVGFDIKSLSEILGHANVNITLNRYVHPTMDLKQSNMEKLTDLFAVR